MDRVEKRKTSPLQNSDKRVCCNDSPTPLDFDNTELYDPSNTTILGSSTPLKPSMSSHSGGAGNTVRSTSSYAAAVAQTTELSFLSKSKLPDEFRDALKAELRSVLFDPLVLDLQSKAVAAELCTEINSLRKQIADLHTQIQARDKRIEALEKYNDKIEQYTRNNNVRISGVPEEKDEDTDKIVVSIANAIGCELDEDNIDRSHRVGPKNNDSKPRAIIVRFVSFREKINFVSNKRKLASVKPEVLFPHAKVQTQGNRPVTHRLYLNDDLTKARAQAAAKARAMKKAGRLQDVWVRGGIIHIKDNSGKSYNITSASELD